MEGFVFTSWELLWNESVSIVTRNNKGGPIANEHLNSSLLSSIAGALHAGRRFISQEDAERIVITAEEKLSDLRQVNCIEGLTLLVINTHNLLLSPYIA